MQNKIRTQTYFTENSFIVNKRTFTLKTFFNGQSEVLTPEILFPFFEMKHSHFVFQIYIWSRSVLYNSKFRKPCPPK